MLRLTRFAAALAGTLCLLLADADAQDAKKLAFFENHIRPLLLEHCLECHNAEKQEGGVRLDHLDAMLAGGESGPAIVPGKPEESLLIEAVRYEGYEMPPKEQLPEEAIEKLVRWVRQGAVWTSSEEAAAPSLGDQDAIRNVADSHWAFQPIKASPSPATSDPDWAKTPIDKFVLAKLETNGLSPSPPAKRTQLIRRAFNDLIGLPPTPEIIAEIFDQPTLSGLTYKDIVVGLLDSDHYGERMARHWMDIARYADTRDFQAAADLRYPFAFTYRDWLIDAFNQDLPYDDFVRKQLAADFLAERKDDPDLAALGFLTVGPLFRNNVLERTADRIDVVTRGMMGLTGSCARCHDHKYDPLSIEDYYALYGVFRDSVSPRELPTIKNPLGQSVPDDLLAEFEAALSAEKGKLAAYEASLANEGMKHFQASPENYLAGYLELEVAKSATIRGLLSKLGLKEIAMTPIADNLNAFRRDADNEAHPVLGPFVKLIAAKGKAFNARKKAFLRDHAKGLHPIIAEAVQQSDSATELVQQIGKAFKDSVKNPSEDLAPLRDLVTAKDGGPFRVRPAAASRASRLLGKGRRKLLDFQEAIADVEASHRGAPNKAMVVEDAKKLAPVFVMYRGEPSRRGPQVSRRFPEYFATGKDANRFENGSGRLELAERIVDRKNPLTARVIVNRIWRLHFGAGLVADAGDFGLRSETPEQLELLNYLSAALTHNDWSLKWLHQTIMLSNTYRQSSSAMSPPMRDDGTSAAEIDATNQLFWRQNRRRLDFETMRDSILAVAGTLDRKIGGRSVKLSETPHPTRRTVYAYVDRVEPNPLFATFDVPSPDVSSAQRTETLVPQQALFAMNNLFVTEQARAMVSRDDFRAAKTDQQRIAVLVRRTLQREPRPGEFGMIGDFVKQADQLLEDRTPIWQYGYGPADGSQDLFQPFPHFDGKLYSYETKRPSPVTGFAMLSRSGGHPGKNSEQSVIRRWTAPKDMLIRISGVLGRASERGDGIRADIKLNGKSIFELEVMTGDQKAIAGYQRVNAGDTLDFVLDPKGSTTSDSFRWTVLVEQRDESKQKVLDSWHSARDFSGPPPPPLGPWEQAAQAMLMTNEFLFVD